jgi:hypothetical protein
LPEEDSHFSKQLGPDPLLFPRYRVGSKNEFSFLTIRKYTIEG